jgi:hypothetical protein
MLKNPKVQLVIGIVVAAWLIYLLVAPGEAQGQGVVILELVLLMCSACGVIGAIAQLAFRK